MRIVIGIVASWLVTCGGNVERGYHGVPLTREAKGLARNRVRALSFF